MNVHDFYVGQIIQPNATGRGYYANEPRGHCKARITEVRSGYVRAEFISIDRDALHSEYHDDYDDWKSEGYSWNDCFAYEAIEPAQHVITEAVILERCDVA